MSGASARGESSGELHSSVLTALGAEIVSGRYPAGHVLTLDAVSNDHDVSRSVAREAVRVLESMGMLAARRRIGITVQPAASWNAFDPMVIRWRVDFGDGAAQLASLSELLRGIEPVAAGLAARRASPEQCRVLTAAVSDMITHAHADDPDSYLKADDTFHRSLLQATGNDMFHTLSRVVTGALTGCTGHEKTPQIPNPDVIALHDEAARSVRVGDEATAERAMRALHSTSETVSS